MDRTKAEKRGARNIKKARDEMGDGIRSRGWRKNIEGQAGGRNKDGRRKGKTYKQFDVTPCFRLVARLIAQEAHLSFPRYPPAILRPLRGPSMCVLSAIPIAL